MDATYTAEDSTRKERSTNKKRRIQSCTNEIQAIEPIFESKIRKGRASMSPAPSGRGRNERGVQTKKGVYNHVLTQYKRLSPFSNPTSEREGAGDMHLIKDPFMDLNKIL